MKKTKSSQICQIIFVWYKKPVRSSQKPRSFILLLFVVLLFTFLALLISTLNRIKLPPLAGPFPIFSVPPHSRRQILRVFRRVVFISRWSMRAFLGITIFGFFLFVVGPDVEAFAAGLDERGIGVRV